ncbi:MAG: transposase [Planctomycetes bacterium]|nr:transposase [Planctomycetota bacterium]
MEARLDGAHFSEATCAWLRDEGIEFSVSVPFERFPELKSLIQQRARWRSIDEEWAWFECDWKPQKWSRGMRCLVYRRRVKTPRKGPIQLDLFEPIERHNEYKVVMTNKRGTPGTVLHFHNGRGSQEGIFAELKSHGSLDYIPTRREIGNRVYMLACVLAHTLGREMQMRATPPSRKTGRTRPCLWVLERLDTLRRAVIQRAGRLTRPQGRLTLTMSTDDALAADFQRLLAPWQNQAA